jgi:aspartate racemase
MTLLAAFQVLLHRLTGEEDICVGTGISNRAHVETEPLIGCFINMLVLRTDLSGDPAFHDVLARVREVALDAYDHQDLPFERVVEDLRPERRAGDTPLIQVAFGLDNAPKQALELTELTLSLRAFDYQSVRFDLTLWVVETAHGLSALWTYSSDLFDEITIRRMHERFQLLLAAIVADPDLAISRLEMLSDAERHEEAASAQSRLQSNRARLRAIRPTAVRRPLAEEPPL